MKSENELNREDLQIIHEGGTERSFTGKYWDSKDVGEYLCHSCGQLLFNSDTKLDSSIGPIGLQGWPAFGDAIPGAIILKEDSSMDMHRVEALCSQCNIHLGHVFDNVEEKGTQHYCVNSCSLNFIPKDKNQE